MRTLVSLAVICGFSLVGACACDEQEKDDTKPDLVLRRFLTAAAVGDGKTVFDLLTPEVQAKLRKLANLATAQAGGRQRYRPSDLLATSLTPRGQISGVKVRTEKENRAEVEVTSTKKVPPETWVLLRLDGRWRVNLPARSLRPAPAQPSAGADTPAVQPPARPSADATAGGDG